AFSYSVLLQKFGKDKVKEGQNDADLNTFSAQIAVILTNNLISLHQSLPHPQGSLPSPRNKRKRSRYAPKGQRAHSPGHRPGYNEAMECALKGQKH
ncbi:MAG: hypothetical protein SPH53_01355, partial [Bacteroidaceae bacterium]|nr:hypothetical protein [Bacteroidaceae bacterium]